MMEEKEQRYVVNWLIYRRFNDHRAVLFLGFCTVFTEAVDSVPVKLYGGTSTVVYWLKNKKIKKIRKNAHLVT